MNGRLSAIFVATAAGLSACATSAPTASVLRAEQVYAASQCGHYERTANARWIADENAWRQFSARLPSVPTPGIDFAREGLLLVEMGQRPSAGYGVDLAAAEVPVRDGVAVVRTRWSAPAPGMLSAQVVTSPCVLIKLSKGDFAAIQVVDQNDQPRARLSVR